MGGQGGQRAGGGGPGPFLQSRLPPGPPPVPRPPRAPSAGTPAERAGAHGPRRPGCAEAGTDRWGAAHGHDGRGQRLLVSWHSAPKAQCVPRLPCLTRSHLSGPPLPTVPAAPPRPDLTALSGSSTRGRREVSLWRHSHSPRGSRTSPSTSFSFQFNSDCASGSTHVTGRRCGEDAAAEGEGSNHHRGAEGPRPRAP